MEKHDRPYLEEDLPSLINESHVLNSVCLGDLLEVIFLSLPGKRSNQNCDMVLTSVNRVGEYMTNNFNNCVTNGRITTNWNEMHIEIDVKEKKKAL